MVTIAQCQRHQSAWNAALATATGGKTFSTHGSTWVWLPARKELMLMFPDSVTAAAVRPALAEGLRLGASSARIWLNSAVDAVGLGPLGFRMSWQPWWMAAPVADVVQGGNDAAILTREVPDYSGPLEQELRVVRVVRVEPHRAWHAVTRDDGGTITGAAYSFYPSGVAGPTGIGGIHQLEVLPGFQRQGLATTLLGATARAAGEAGAATLTVNATPQGYPFFSSRGFTLLGRGRTYVLDL